MSTDPMEPKAVEEAAVGAHLQDGQVTHIDDAGTMVEEAVLETIEKEKEGVLLEVDEGDALFGKRSEVKDAHDRY